MKFKVGDKVRVCNPYSGSEFEDGDIVTIVGFGSEDDPDCYEAVLKKETFHGIYGKMKYAPLQLEIISEE